MQAGGRIARRYAGGTRGAAQLRIGTRASALAALLLASIASSPLRAQSQTVTVGPALGCTSTTLAGALAGLPRLGPGVVHRVRVMSASPITGGATLDRMSVRIEGGHTSCTSAVPQPGVLSRISGTAAVPLLRLRNVTEPGAEYRVELRQLEFRDGPAGAIEVDGRVALSLDAVELTNNRAPIGGGLRVIGRPAGWTNGALVSFGDGVVINANEAVAGDGGGIHCTAGGGLGPAGGGLLLVINNVASGRGGGLYLAGCDFGAPPIGAAPGVRIANNRAAGGGGAALVDSTAQVAGAGFDIESNSAVGAGDGGGLLLQRAVLRATASLRLAGNRAGGSGGGAWIDSGQLELQAATWDVRGNTALVGGGGLHVQGDSLLETSGSGACREACVRIEDNEVTGTGINQGAGGALVALDNSVVAWDRVRVRGNRSDSAAVLFARGAAPFGVAVEWSNVLASANSGAYQFGFEGAPFVVGSGGVALRLRLATLAANEARAAGSAVPQAFRLFDGASLALRGVVVDQPGWQTLGTPVGAQVALSGACVISREATSLATRGVPALAADPRLDAAVRLRADSPAIDACPIAALDDPAALLGAAPLQQDLDGARRPVRVRAAVGGSEYDAGAQEYAERVFGSGFESGAD